MVTTHSEPAAIGASSVTLVRWPEERSLRRVLETAGAPRLLVVESVTELPPVLDPLEDWVQPSASPAEVSARTRNLIGRSLPASRSRPVLEPGDIIRCGRRWVALAPSSVSIARALLDDFGQCVPRCRLEAAEQADGTRRSGLDNRISRLRARITPLGLGIRAVRARGFVLTSS